MNWRRQFTLFISLCLMVMLSSCGLFGIHFKVHNPRRTHHHPTFSKETILLGELSSLRANFDVYFYDLDIAIDPINKSLSGWVGTSARAVQDIDSIQLDLDQPLALQEIRMDTREGEKLQYRRVERAVYIKLGRKIKQGELFSLHVKYQGKPVVARKPPWAGGSVWKKDKQDNHWLGVVCEVDGSSLWFPCKDHTSDEADSVHTRFTIPGELVVVSNGTFAGSEKNGNNSSYKWHVHYPINTYNITFYAGDFVRITDSYTGITGKTLKMEHYVLRPNAAIAAGHFKQVKDIIRIYEQLYGEYPWYKDGYRLVESPYMGQEHQTAIAYGNRFRNDLSGKDDYIILHETGHEWFGNAVTVADLADVWIQEGITTYGEALYLEKKYSYEEAQWHLLTYRWTIKNKLPLVGPKGRRYFDYKDGDVYTKGAWMLHSLRNEIDNDSLFFRILKTFYQENKLKLCDSKTFIETVNRLTGEDHQWFFDQYLYRSKVPFLEYYLADGHTFYYKWRETDPSFTKLRVRVKMEGNGRDFWVYPSSKVQRLKIPAQLPACTGVHFSDDRSLYGLDKKKKLVKQHKRLYNSGN